jgi:hypothetical protein
VATELLRAVVVAAFVAIDEEVVTFSEVLVAALVIIEEELVTFDEVTRAIDEVSEVVSVVVPDGNDNRVVFAEPSLVDTDFVTVDRVLDLTNRGVLLGD